LQSKWKRKGREVGGEGVGRGGDLLKQYDWLK